MRFLLLFIFSFQAFSYTNCKITYSARSPFLVSDIYKSEIDQYDFSSRFGRTNIKRATLQRNEKKDLLTEGLYDPSSKQFTGKILKRGTLVRTVKDIQLDPDAPDHLVEIEVLSTRNKDLNKILEGRTGNKLFDSKERGYIYDKSLKTLDKSDYLMLKEDTRFFLSDNFKSIKLEPGQAIAPIMDGNRYKINQCRDDDGQIRYLYLYQVIDLKTRKKVAEIQAHYSHFNCVSIDHIIKDDFQDFSKLLDQLKNLYSPTINANNLPFNEWGYVKLPTKEVDNPSNDLIAEAYDNSFVVYKGSDPKNSDTWGKPVTICKLTTVASQWKKYCKEVLKLSTHRCKLQIGDIAFMSPTMGENGKDPLGHRHHKDGHCIDMRPMRKDTVRKGTNIHSQDYDPGLTGQLIKFLQVNGASPLYFNDQQFNNLANPDISNQSCHLDNPKKDLGAGLQTCIGHDNHIHFCFHPNYMNNSDCLK